VIFAGIWLNIRAQLRGPASTVADHKTVTPRH
jgi:hypothetical protein